MIVGKLTNLFRFLYLDLHGHLMLISIIVAILVATWDEFHS